MDGRTDPFRQGRASDARDPRPLLCQTLYSGLSGVGDVALNLVAGDVERKYRHAILFVGVEPVLASHIALCRRYGVAFQAVRTVHRAAWLSWPAIHRALVRLSPDIVLVHGGGASLLPALLQRRGGKMVVQVEHQPLPLRNRRDWLATSLALRAADRLVALTEEYRDALRASFASAAALIEVIPNGVDVDVFQPVPRRRRAQQVRIGMAGRFNRSKRFDILLWALARLIRDAPDVGWTLSLAGDGLDRTALEAMARTLGIQANVEFCGLLTPLQLPDWFRSLDIYAHASNGETLSMAIIQAMATGLPLIASNVPGIRSILSGPNPPGVLAEAQDGDAFARLILSLVNEPANAKNLGQSARALAIDRYSHRAMFDAYDQLFQRARR